MAHKKGIYLLKLDVIPKKIIKLSILLYTMVIVEHISNGTDITKYNLILIGYAQILFSNNNFFPLNRTGLGDKFVT